MGQDSPGEHFHRKEIDPGQDRYMRSDEVLPVRLLGALGRRRDHVAPM
jgi:hypothetical protein